MSNTLFFFFGKYFPEFFSSIASENIGENATIYYQYEMRAKLKLYIVHVQYIIISWFCSYPSNLFNGNPNLLKSLQIQTDCCRSKYISSPSRKKKKLLNIPHEERKCNGHNMYLSCLTLLPPCNCAYTSQRAICLCFSD